MNDPAKARDLMPPPKNAQPHECAQCGRSATVYDPLLMHWFCGAACVVKFKRDLIDCIKSDDE